MAQAPKGFNYQAIVRDDRGAVLADQPVSVRMALHRDGVDGERLYRETHLLQTNAFGLIDLVVGNGTSGDRFSDIDWSAAGKIWVKIEIDVDGSGYKQLGAQQLMSVPFALYADKAGSASPALQSFSQQEINEMNQPVEGVLLVNTTSGRLNLFHQSQWYELPMSVVQNEFSCGDPFVDQRDGQSYRTVQIGTQCWMAENLNIGTEIKGSVNQTNNETIEKYCYQDISTACATYGGLYQWDELMNYTTAQQAPGICPDGWHIPSDEEVQQMEMSLGMSASDAGRSNTWRGTNQGLMLAVGGGSGYDALYSGRRVTGGLYTAMGEYEYLWTSTPSVDAAWRRCFRVNDGTIGRYNTFPKEYGMSVRCIKDQ